MKISLLVASIALSSTLFSNETSMIGPKRQDRTSFIGLVPGDLQSCYLYPYMETAGDIDTAITNIHLYLSALKIDNTISDAWLGKIAQDIATQFSRGQVEVVCRFSAAGMARADQWLGGTLGPDGLTQIVNSEFDKIDPSSSQDANIAQLAASEVLLLPIMRLFPEVLANRELLEKALLYGSPDLLTFILSYDQAESDIGSMLTTPGPFLTRFFALDQKHAVILAQTFGLRVLLDSAQLSNPAGSIWARTRSETLRDLALHFFNSPADLILLVRKFLSDRRILLGAYWQSHMITLISMSNPAGETLLMKLSEYGFADEGLILFLSPERINKADVQGETALTKAIRARNLDLVNLLLDRGADAFKKDNSQNDSFSHAHAAGHSDILNCLTVKAVDQKGQTLLIRAARSGNVEQVRSLLAQGADPFIRDASEKDAFYYASESGSSDILNTLTMNIDASTTDEQGRTVLGKATQTGNVPLLITLLSRGANPFKADNNGNNAFYYANVSGMYEVLWSNVDVKATDDQGRTALIIATQTGDLELVKNLLDRGSDAFQSDAYGKSALEYSDGKTKIKSLFQEHLLKEYPRIGRTAEGQV
jgi:uncharacterized protein